MVDHFGRINPNLEKNKNLTSPSHDVFSRLTITHTVFGTYLFQTSFGGGFFLFIFLLLIKLSKTTNEVHIKSNHKLESGMGTS